MLRGAFSASLTTISDNVGATPALAEYAAQNWANRSRAGLSPPASVGLLLRSQLATFVFTKKWAIKVARALRDAVSAGALLLLRALL